MLLLPESSSLGSLPFKSRKALLGALSWNFPTSTSLIRRHFLSFFFLGRGVPWHFPFAGQLWVPPVMGQASCYGEFQRPGLLECRGYFFSSFWLHLRFFSPSVKSNNIINNVEAGGKKASPLLLLFSSSSLFTSKVVFSSEWPQIPFAVDKITRPSI